MIQTTGIGGLPFKHQNEAFDHIESYYSIPFLPELPSKSQDNLMPPLMPPFMQRILTPTLFDKIATSNSDFLYWPKERIRSEVAEISLTSLGVEQFLERFFNHSVIKMQLIGPHCLASLLKLNGKYDSVKCQNFARLWLNELAQRILQSCQPHQKIYFIWDEPIIGFDAASPDYSIDNFSSVRFGIHCCDRTFSETDFKSNHAQIYSVDVTEITQSPDINDYCNNKFLGVLDPQSINIAKATKFLASLNENTPLILTPSCGTGNLTIDQEIAVASALKNLQMT